MKTALTKKIIPAILLGIMPLNNSYGMDDNEKIQLYGMFVQCMEEKKLTHQEQPGKDSPFFKDLECAKAMTSIGKHIDAAQAWDRIIGFAPYQKRVVLCRDIITDLDKVYKNSNKEINKDPIQGVLSQANINLDKLIEEHKDMTPVFLNTFMLDLNKALCQELKVESLDSKVDPYEMYKQKILKTANPYLTDIYRNIAVQSYRATGQHLKAISLTVELLLNTSKERY